MRIGLRAPSEMKASTLFRNNTVCSTALIVGASWEPHRTTMALLIAMGSEEHEKSRQREAAKRRLGKRHEIREFRSCAFRRHFFQRIFFFRRTDFRDDCEFPSDKTVAMRNLCFQMVTAGDCLVESGIRVERKKYPVK